ncbi:MAG: hypothetical protein K0S47_1721 [Herbinix sp.]|jgi:putative endonuclease|nr:hypothetical protein [Herbinix sp.]
MNKRAVGTRYEECAADFLTKNQYRMIEKNFHCRMGEIDIIAKNEGYLCFVEVKYRNNSNTGIPSEAITPGKIRRITYTAQYYLMVHQLPQDTPCRFDAVVILGDEISLIKNAFDGI